MAANRGQQFLKPIGNQATDAMYAQCICMLYMYFLYIRRPSTKMIMMIRNLKDVIVSAYNHHIQKKAKPYDQNYEFYKMYKQILHGRYG